MWVRRIAEADTPAADHRAELSFHDKEFLRNASSDMDDERGILPAETLLLHTT